MKIPFCKGKKNNRGEKSVPLYIVRTESYAVDELIGTDIVDGAVYKEKKDAVSAMLADAELEKKKRIAEDGERAEVTEYVIGDENTLELGTDWLKRWEVVQVRLAD